MDEIEKIKNSTGRIHGYLQFKKLSDFSPTGKCLSCNGELPKYRKKYCSDECSYDFWKNNIRPFFISWSVIRNDVIERDGGKCVICGSKEILEVHHIRPIKSKGNNTMENLQTLCEDCHNMKHSKKTNIRQMITLDKFTSR
jgi:hypothetical protein